MLTPAERWTYYPFGRPEREGARTGIDPELGPYSEREQGACWRFLDPRGSYVLERTAVRYFHDHALAQTVVIRTERRF